MLAVSVRGRCLATILMLAAHTYVYNRDYVVARMLLCVFSRPPLDFPPDFFNWKSLALLVSVSSPTQQVYRAVYNGEENASFASTLHNLGMAFRAMAEESKKLEKIPLMERAAESFERCVQIREKVWYDTVGTLRVAETRVLMPSTALAGVHPYCCCVALTMGMFFLQESS